MRWEAASVSDDELAAEWVVIEDGGKLTLVVRESAIDADPCRLTPQIMAALRMLDSPRHGFRIVA